jgi:predicted TIM-barrel fold metal-dependent hydrolase
MIVDCHVHVSAFTPPHGSTSARLQRSIPFRYMRWHLGIQGADEAAERQVARVMTRTIDKTVELDAAVVLAFDAVYTPEGDIDEPDTHLYVTNDYVMELAQSNPKMLFGASVHPYRKDAVAEIERCVKAGAVLLKWLPIVQKFNPADPRCFPVYEALGHYKLPLLSHTGGEQSLPVLLPRAADPMLLKPAIKRGVTIIAAHCGTHSAPGETSYLPQFMQLARDHEHFYGDTAALNLPTRWYAYRTIMADPVVSRKLVHGSDWPIPAFPSPWHHGILTSRKLMQEKNWMRRDILIKKAWGLDDAYWHRAATLLREPHQAMAAPVAVPTAQRY